MQSENSLGVDSSAEKGTEGGWTNNGDAFRMSKSGTGVSSSGGIFLNEARRFENRTRRSEFLLFFFFLFRYFFVFSLRIGSGFVFGMLREVDDVRKEKWGESGVFPLLSASACENSIFSAWSVEFPISCTFIGCHYRRASIQISRSRRESFGPIS